MSQLAALVRASKVLTSSAAPSADDTVTIAGVVYTFKASVGTTANEVLIGISEATSLQNLKDAVNLTGTPGTQYGSATVENPHVYAATDGVHTLTATAKLPGTIGNFISIAEAHDNGSWAGAATLLSGGTGDFHAALEAVRTGCQMSAELEQVLLELTEGGASA